MHNGDWNNGMDGGSWWWIPMTIMMVVFWGGLIWLVVTLVRRPNYSLHAGPPGFISQQTAPSPTAQTAQEILAERLARGEIEPDDYRSRLDALNHRTGP